MNASSEIKDSMLLFGRIENNPVNWIEDENLFEGDVLV
jgi:hypothetical protein